MGEANMNPQTENNPPAQDAENPAPAPDSHTAHEAELVNQIKELNRTVETLKKQNREMFIKMTGGQYEEKTLTDKVTDGIVTVARAKHAPAVERMNLPEPVKYTGPEYVKRG